MHIPHPRRSARLGAPLLAVGLIALAACGSDSKSEPTTSTAAAAVSTAAAPTTQATTATTAASATSAATETSEPATTAAAPASDPYTLRLGFISTTKNWGGPEGYSYSDGELNAILAEAGVTDIELFGFPNGPNLNQALQAGQLDIGLYGDTPAIVGRAAGLGTRVLVQSTVGIDAWIVTATDGPKTVADLKGKSIAVAQGSYMDRYLRGLLEAEDLTNDVDVVNIIPPADQKAALDRGDIQAIAATATNAVGLRDQGYQIIDKAADHPTLVGTSVTVITDDALEAHPDLPAAWRAAHAQAIDEINADQDAFNQFSADYQGIDVAITTEINIIGPDGTFTQYPKDSLTPDGKDLLLGTKQFLVDHEYAKEDFDFDDWYLPE